MGKGIYALVAIIRTEGQVNRMSDDLISRKALLEVIDISFIIPILKMNLRPEHEAVLKIREIIMNMPTAFDKENVLEELNDTKDIPHDDSAAEITSTRIWNKAITKSIKIVKKGGIE